MNSHVGGAVCGNRGLLFERNEIIEHVLPWRPQYSRATLVRCLQLTMHTYTEQYMLCYTCLQCNLRVKT